MDGRIEVNTMKPLEAPGLRQAPPSYMIFLVVFLFFITGLLGFLICHLLKKKGYRCRTDMDEEEEEELGGNTEGLVKTPLLAFLPITTQSTQAWSSTPATCAPRVGPRRAADTAELLASGSALENRRSSLWEGEHLDQLHESGGRKESIYNLRSMFKDVRPPTENLNAAPQTGGKRKKSLTIFGLRRGSDPGVVKATEESATETPETQARVHTENTETSTSDV
ncbi:uncharacterized protein LOC114470542 isoform X2 [Gouania willdenowi]|uniref:uncharacterized protein LOC114470542 isoform X2 n=1 Tax=Gouania willdenowi TaxID=441366 RepID=UPI0010546D3C|nr:uncharacterized protein LOC114470542 isoform X2 [Gouania willdenowi]